MIEHACGAGIPTARCTLELVAELLNDRLTVPGARWAATEIGLNAPVIHLGYLEECAVWRLLGEGEDADSVHARARTEMPLSMVELVLADLNAHHTPGETRWYCTVREPVVELVAASGAGPGGAGTARVRYWRMTDEAAQQAGLLV